jgi:hypothetical protein
VRIGDSLVDVSHELTDLGGGGCAQLPEKETLQLFIMLAGGVSSTSAGEEADQIKVCFLAQWIHRHGPPRVLKGPREIPHPF